MRAFLLLTRMRVLDVMRKRSSAAFFMLLPLALLGVVGLVFANGHPFERRHVALVDLAGGGEAELAAIGEAVRAHDEIRVTRLPTEAAATGRLRSRMVSAVVVRERVAGAIGTRLVVGPRDSVFARGLAEVMPAPPARRDVLDVPAFGYVHYLFPGVLTFSVLLAGLFGMGHAMVRFRQTLFLKKLATTPLPKHTFVAAQIVARALLVMVQLVVLVGGAMLVFDLPVTLAGLGWTAVITLLGLLTFMGMGFALACAVETEELMVDVINAVNLILVFLSELFFPVDGLAAPLPAISELLPSTHMVRLAREVLLHGVTDPATLAPGLVHLSVWAAATFALSLWLFRWHR